MSGVLYWTAWLVLHAESVHYKREDGRERGLGVVVVVVVVVVCVCV